MNHVSIPGMSRAVQALVVAAAMIAGVPVLAAEPVHPGTRVLHFEVDGENLREIVGPAGSGAVKPGEDSPEKAIGSITTNDTFCYQPDPSLNECFVNWRLHSVSAGTDNMRSLRIRLDGRLVLNMQGFFQTSLLYQAAMVNPAGFKVLCGAPSQADPLIGASYSFQITGVDSNNLTANNFGTVNCPAFSP